jgi:hypothetical protein
MSLPLCSFQSKYTVWHERCHAVKVGLQGGILLDCVRLPNTSRVTKRPIRTAAFTEIAYQEGALLEECKLHQWRPSSTRQALLKQGEQDQRR